MSIAHWAFWISVAWLAYVWIGYPIALVLLSLKWRFHPAIADNYYPVVSVLLAARNEEKDIPWKLAQTLAWDYPQDRLEVLVGSDASTDGTDDAIRSVQDPRLTFVRSEERSGKNRILNRLAGMARGEILFFTDANTHIEQRSLRRMVRYFADPRVGCVTGLQRHLDGSDASAITMASNAYSDYESALAALESRVGSVLVCDGSIYCLRKSLFRDLDPDLANDLEHPIRAGAAGAAVLYEPEARSFEYCTSAAQEEFLRRRRIAAQGALGMWRLRHELRGIRLWQFASRKLLRWLTPIPLAVALAASFLLRQQQGFAVCTIVQMLVYGTALVGAWRKELSRAQAIFRLPLTALAANLAVFIGVLDACRGKKFATWNIAVLSRGIPGESR